MIKKKKNAASSFFCKKHFSKNHLGLTPNQLFKSFLNDNNSFRKPKLDRAPKFALND